MTEFARPKTRAKSAVPVSANLNWNLSEGSVSSRRSGNLVLDVTMSSLPQAASGRFEAAAAFPHRHQRGLACGLEVYRRTAGGGALSNQAAQTGTQGREELGQYPGAL